MTQSQTLTIAAVSVPFFIFWEWSSGYYNSLNAISAKILFVCFGDLYYYVVAVKCLIYTGKIF